MKFMRFNIAQRIVTPDGTATTAFLRWINDAVSALTRQTNTNTDLLAQIEAALEQAGIAITNANAAADAANAAVADASLVNSYVSPANLLTSEIDPADPAKAIITIANHSRIYGDGVTVAVTGATISGRDLETNYYISYVDVARAGGTVTHTATTDYLAAGQTGDRHLVGAIRTPESGATDPVEGGGTRPPGVPSWKFPDAGI